MAERWTRLDTPVGVLGLCSDGTALRAVTLDGSTAGEPGRDDVLREAARQLTAYFAGARTSFDLPLAPRGTAFQCAVWDELARIPFGRTRSYAEVAAAVGRPTAVRAVGRANGANPLPVVVPCHRVVGADGSLTGYGGGLDVKRALLAHEGVALALT